MIFTRTALPDVYVIDLEPIRDDRGFFARAWCHDEFEKHGLQGTMAQANIGVNRHKGTLRGLHYQEAPWSEVKLVRCTRGAIYDVFVDLRPDSPTYARWVGVELTADNHRMLYAPEGFAHGYQTLTDDAEVLYQTSQVYARDAARGVRFDDPAFGIVWPLPVGVMSEADKRWPLLTHHKETS